LIGRRCVNSFPELAPFFPFPGIKEQQDFSSAFFYFFFLLFHPISGSESFMRTLGQV